jgi:hypothetical protein
MLVDAQPLVMQAVTTQSVLKRFMFAASDADSAIALPHA